MNSKFWAVQHNTSRYYYMGLQSDKIIIMHKQTIARNTKHSQLFLDTVCSSVATFWTEKFQNLNICFPW